MKVTVKRNLSGKPVSVDLTDTPVKPTPIEGEKIMKLIGEALGLEIGAVKVSSYWLLGDTSEAARKWCPVYGHRPGEQTRNFEKLITHGLQLAVVRLVPLA